MISHFHPLKQTAIDQCLAHVICSTCIWEAMTTYSSYGCRGIWGCQNLGYNCANRIVWNQPHWGCEVLWWEFFQKNWRKRILMVSHQKGVVLNCNRAGGVGLNICCPWRGKRYSCKGSPRPLWVPHNMGLGHMGSIPITLLYQTCKNLSWQWPGLSLHIWGHRTWPKTVLGHFLKKVPCPKIVWGHMSCVLRAGGHNLNL